MGSMIKMLGKYKKSVLLILILLLIQAFCELSLPNLTADVVDVGLQQYGIDGPVMEKISGDTFNYLNMLMSEEESRTFGADYRQVEDHYELKLLEDRKSTRLNSSHANISYA